MNKKVIIVGGVGAGDEGKGTIVDYFGEKYDPELFLRYNGGSQALHHVVRPDGLIHGFRQIGSGTFACPKARTYLSRFMVVDPFFLYEEVNEIVKKGFKYSRGQIIVDRDCVVVTPFHRLINQMLEIYRGEKKHGSCGRGIGEALKDWSSMGNDVLLAGDLIDPQRTLYKLRHLLALKVDIADQLFEVAPTPQIELELQHKLAELKDYCHWLDRLTQNYSDLFKFGFFKYGDSKILKRLLNQSKTTVFEGAQGALLDPALGFVPYVTKTRTNFDNADQILEQANYHGGVLKVGVMRAYATRHGNGPFVTEATMLFPGMLEEHNYWNEWQGRFRIGWPDLVATRYALDIMRYVDYLAVTNIDRFVGLPKIKVCNAYTADVGEPDSSFNSFFKYTQNHKSKKIKKIKIPEDLKPDQTELTKLLSKCKPVYKSLPGLNELGYADFLKEQLGVKVAIVSRGPTHKDKVEILPPC